MGNSVHNATGAGIRLGAVLKLHDAVKTLYKS